MSITGKTLKVFKKKKSFNGNTEYIRHNIKIRSLDVYRNIIGFLNKNNNKILVTHERNGG